MPVLVSGCKDASIDISDPPLLNISLPVFFTSQNTSAGVTCTPEFLTNYGEHDVNCTALDYELNASTSCNFVLNLTKEELKESVTDTPSTLPKIVLSTTTTQEPCKFLFLLLEIPLYRNVSLSYFIFYIHFTLFPNLHLKHCFSL